MSAGLDQRAKGQPNQVANGKDGMKDGFDSYLQAQHQQPAGVYNAAPMSSPNVNDHYSYYPSVSSFPYFSQGINEGTWSNGDHMSFLGGYGQVNNEYMSNSGMFGFSYGQPSFAGWDFPGSDYTSFTWGNSAPAQQPGAQRKADARAYEESVYCHPDSMRPMEGYAVNGDMDGNMKVMDQGMKNMNIASEQYVEQEVPTSANDNVQPVANDSATAPSGPKKMSWANVASQPAKPQAQIIKSKTNSARGPVFPYKNMDIGTWETKNNMATKQVTAQARQPWSASSRRAGGGGGGQQGGGGGAYNSQPVSNSSSNTSAGGHSNASKQSESSTENAISSAVLEKLRTANQYNPKDFNTNPKAARFFIIKSYSEDDIHRSIKYSIWCSTDHGNKRLDRAYRECDKNVPVYLLYSVNGSGHFCGMAQMLSPVDYSNDSSVWAQDKWKGQFQVKWIYVKDVPNSQLRHIRLENNENKPVTNSRDTQEVPLERGRQVLKILHTYRHSTSIFDDFIHYEKRQEDERKEEHDDGRRDNSPREGAPHRDRDRERERDGGHHGRGAGGDRDRDHRDHRNNDRADRDGGRGGGDRRRGGGHPRDRD